MAQKHMNKVNPCARILGKLADTCFLITAETDFDAHFNWSAHVNEVTVTVQPKGASIDHAVLEFNEYLNLPTSSGQWAVSEFRTDTYPKVKAFAKQLSAFYDQRVAA